MDILKKTQDKCQLHFGHQKVGVLVYFKSNFYEENQLKFFIKSSYVAKILFSLI